jgi:hypothetical protein
MRIIAGALLLFVAAGCSRAPGVPLETGRIWRYTGADGSDFTIEISGEESVRGQLCKVLTISSGGQPVLQRYLREEGSGIRELRTRLGETEFLYKEPIWFARGPAEAGTQFGEGVDTGPPGGQVRYLGTIEAEEEVTVPAGTFRCWRVKFSAEMGSSFRMYETRWICPSVGIVKLEHESAFNSNLLRLSGELSEKP